MNDANTISGIKIQWRLFKNFQRKYFNKVQPEEGFPEYFRA